MTEVMIQQMPAFKKAYKKLHTQTQTQTQTQTKAQVNEAIRRIVKNPSLGQEKKGDLSGLCVYKFKVNTKEMRLAYVWDPKKRILLTLGVHENFYRDLKRKK